MLGLQDWRLDWMSDSYFFWYYGPQSAPSITIQRMGRFPEGDPEAYAWTVARGRGVLERGRARSLTTARVLAMEVHLQAPSLPRVRAA